MEVAAATSSGSTEPGWASWRSSSSAALARVDSSAPWMARAAGQQPAQLAAQVVLALDRLAEIGDDGRQELTDAPLERRQVVVVEQATEPAESDDDRLPHGELAFTAEALDEGQEVDGRKATGDDLVPGIVDEVVALERVEGAEHLARHPAAQLVAVGDTVEAVAAGVDDERRRRIGAAAPVLRRPRAGSTSARRPSAAGPGRATSSAPRRARACPRRNAKRCWRSTSSSPSTEALTRG